MRTFIVEGLSIELFPTMLYVISAASVLRLSQPRVTQSPFFSSRPHSPQPHNSRADSIKRSAAQAERRLGRSLGSRGRLAISRVSSLDLQTLIDQLKSSLCARGLAPAFGAHSAPVRSGPNLPLFAHSSRHGRALARSHPGNEIATLLGVPRRRSTCN